MGIPAGLRGRVTGTLLSDLEMAALDYLTTPHPRALLLGLYRIDVTLESVAERWHVFPEALRAFIDYQDPGKWHDDFVHSAERDAIAVIPA